LQTDEVKRAHQMSQAFGARDRHAPSNCLRRPTTGVRLSPKRPLGETSMRWPSSRRRPRRPSAAQCTVWVRIGDIATRPHLIRTLPRRLSVGGF
jgi:hypothetical protein